MALSCLFVFLDARAHLLEQPLRRGRPGRQGHAVVRPGQIGRHILRRFHQNADNILVLDHGNVVEQGTHEQLMARKGQYYQLYASQFE